MPNHSQHSITSLEWRTEALMYRITMFYHTCTGTHACAFSLSSQIWPGNNAARCLPGHDDVIVFPADADAERSALTALLRCSANPQSANPGPRHQSMRHTPTAAGNKDRHAQSPSTASTSRGRAGSISLAVDCTLRLYSHLIVCFEPITKNNK